MSAFEITHRKNFTVGELAGLWASGRRLVYAGTYTRFGVRNGICVPMEQRDFAHVDPSNPARLVETIVHDTGLCRELWVRRKQDLATFKRLDAEAGEILRRHRGDVREGFEEVPPEWLREEILGSQLSSESVSVALGSLQWDASNRLRARPSVLAGMVLSNCLYQHLGPFLDDDRIWQTGSQQ